MGFSCSIKLNGEVITGSEGPISSYMYYLGPSSNVDTDAPWSQEDFRSVISQCSYGDKCKDAAVDAFKLLQSMAQDNLDSVYGEHYCEHCQNYSTKDVTPRGWSVDALKALLSIDAEKITYLEGGC